MPTQVPKHLSDIFERADVYLSVNPYDYILVVKSYNTEAPLTEDEKQMIREFYDDTPYYDIRFVD